MESNVHGMSPGIDFTRSLIALRPLALELIEVVLFWLPPLRALLTRRELPPTLARIRPLTVDKVDAAAIGSTGGGTRLCEKMGSGDAEGAWGVEEWGVEDRGVPYGKNGV